MPQPYRGPDKPTFPFIGLCIHCAESNDVDLVEDEPVCEPCFYTYYNRDWTRRMDLVKPSDLRDAFSNDWQQRKHNV